jgi:hypothetical protein
VLSSGQKCPELDLKLEVPPVSWETLGKERERRRREKEKEIFLQGSDNRRGRKGILRVWHS